MSHTFLSIKTELIPQETKDNLPEYGLCLFSNDGSRVLIDGYNELNNIVLAQETIDNWLQWSVNPAAVIAVMMHPDNVINYTKNELKTERLNPKSIWYAETEVG